MKLQRLTLLALVLGLAAAPGTAAGTAPDLYLAASPAGAPLTLAASTAPLACTAGLDLEPSGAEDTDGKQAAAKICVWSCQYNPNFGTWKYWFAPNLSSCPVTQCQPRNGSSPSGTPCNQGDPDIGGVCVP